MNLSKFTSVTNVYGGSFYFFFFKSVEFNQFHVNIPFLYLLETSSMKKNSICGRWTDELSLSLCLSLSLSVSLSLSLSLWLSLSVSLSLFLSESKCHNWSVNITDYAKIQTFACENSEDLKFTTKGLCS